MSEIPKPIGRPSIYDPAMCDRVVECGREGMGVAEMSAEIGISRETFNAWRKSRPDFSDAVKEAVSLSQAWWEKQGRMATFGAIDGFNATSYIFQMKNRFRDDWRDKHDVEHSGPDGAPLQFVIRDMAKDA